MFVSRIKKNTCTGVCGLPTIISHQRNKSVRAINWFILEPIPSKLIVPHDASYVYSIPLAKRTWGKHSIIDAKQSFGGRKNQRRHKTFSIIKIYTLDWQPNWQDYTFQNSLLEPGIKLKCGFQPYKGHYWNGMFALPGKFSSSYSDEVCRTVSFKTNKFSYFS